MVKLDNKNIQDVEYAAGKFYPLKVMTLNIWGGQIKEPLLNFIKVQQDIDIICMQEVYKDAAHKICTNDDPVSLNIFNEIEAILPNHKGYFSPVVENIYGIALFIKKNLAVIQQAEEIIYENNNYIGIGPTHSRTLQWLQLRVENSLCTIVNLHGLWNGRGKTDSDDRIAQSQKIKAFLDRLKGPKIVCGDFNLHLDTESIRILETDMINLIKKFNISSTRTSFYTKPEKYADYVFISPEIKISKFEVLTDEVSDHTPLVGQFLIDTY